MKFFSNIPGKGFTNFLLHIVQTYFVFSGWLLVVQVHFILDKNKKLTFKEVVNRIFHRYLRLFPTLAVVISIHASSWFVKLVDSPQSDLLDIDYQGCKKNWWATLLFLNNFLYGKNMCHVGTWYLANDFQMYTISLIMFYFIFKFKLGIRAVGFMLVIPWLIQVYTIYYNNLGTIYEISPKNARYEDLILSQSVYPLYTSFYSNFGSYAVGLIFGTIYCKYKHLNIKVNMVVTIFWILGFFGMPLLAVTLSLFEYSHLFTAIIGASLRPLFSLGIAIGVLGMSHNMGGVVKKICEWEFAEFICRWSYSTYLSQFGISLVGFMVSEVPLELSNFILVVGSIVAVVSSFIVGLVIHLLVELPLANIATLVLNVATNAFRLKSD